MKRKKKIVSRISKLHHLKVLDIESTTFLQVCRINQEWHNLSHFAFSRVWKRIHGSFGNPYNVWVEIFESEPTSKWGLTFWLYIGELNMDTFVRHFSLYTMMRPK